jgi:DNA invertase Pin-like site-specific DNA recombinase/predicted nuclease with RNAse H fold
MKPVRCAIYTRKSTEEGLEQDFNSLDAQREACAAYILSQAGEGWTRVPDSYDDGGLSGGSLERPALKRLLDDVSAGRIDIIVVYKVDRLTRSLLDFARLVEAFDVAGVSFVSVTQAFNTTSSMGRLTLNMLLSFAQFEREVTAERIRDKLAASKARGMWMGGTPPLGYRPEGRSLAVVEPHAVIVREIFSRYLRLGAVRELAEELAAEGIEVPARTSSTGRAFGQRPFCRGQLYGILRNPVYVGLISHKGRTYPGNQPALVDRETWDAVQAKLSANLKGERRGRRAAQGLLSGRITDEAGDPLIPVHTRKGSRRYAYYASRAKHHLVAHMTLPGLRLPVGETDRLVASTILRKLEDPWSLAEQAGLKPLDTLPERCLSLTCRLREEPQTIIPALVTWVVVTLDSLEITLSREGLSDALKVPLSWNRRAPLVLEAKARRVRAGGTVRLASRDGAAAVPRADPTLVQLVVRARHFWRRLRSEGITVTQLAKAEGISPTWAGRILRVAFLSPAVVEAILDGRVRTGVDAKKLLQTRAIPMDWNEQERLYLPG